MQRQTTKRKEGKVKKKERQSAEIWVVPTSFGFSNRLVSRKVRRWSWRQRHAQYTRNKKKEEKISNNREAEDERIVESKSPGKKKWTWSKCLAFKEKSKEWHESYGWTYVECNPGDIQPLPHLSVHTLAVNRNLHATQALDKRLKKGKLTILCKYVVVVLGGVRFLEYGINCTTTHEMVITINNKRNDPDFPKNLCRGGHNGGNGEKKKRRELMSEGERARVPKDKHRKRGYRREGEVREATRESGIEREPSRHHRSASQGDPRKAQLVIANPQLLSSTLNERLWHKREGKSWKKKN